ncbi:MAG: ATP-binding cassette domain-containing protein, partial [Limnobacter sp.]
MLNNVALQKIPADELATQLAYVPQTHNSSLGFSVGETVLMGRTRQWGLFGGPKAADHQAVDEALEQLGITALKKRDFSLLSGGQQQLVLIAR